MFLELDGLEKTYGTRTVVHGLSLSVDKGEFVCLLGPSGCGKTTILGMVGGFVRPTSGRVLLDGEDVTRLDPERRPVSTVFQSYGLFPHMTVAQNVAYGLKFQKMRRKEAQTKAVSYLEMVGLAEYADARVHELSGGQQQRVALARALAVEPKLCLLDEPFSNLDAGLRVSMRGELKRLQRSLGCTMLFVTHDQEEALALSDRMAVLREGTLEQCGDPVDMLRHPANKYVAGFLGLDDYLWHDGELFKRVSVGCG